MDSIIQVKGLRKVYGPTVAVEDLSLEVSEGEIFGMVGPNGAGKTTTIECLEGLRKADAGRLRVLGVDPQCDGQVIRLQAGMQLQQSNLPDRMRVWEALDLYSSFYPKAASWETLLLQLGLEEKRNTPFAKLSGGQKQRLFIALALLPDPRLIFLDELTTGLDPQARHAIWDLIQGVRRQGKTIVLTTHFMEEAERLCDRVAILDHGRIVAMDTPSRLIDSMEAEERVIFTLVGFFSKELEKEFSRIGRVEVQGKQVAISGKNHCTPSLLSQVVNFLDDQKVPYRDLHTEQPTLESVFLSLTGNAMRD